MMFAIVGALIAVLEVYAWLFRPDSFRAIDPITIGLPIVIAAGILTRPATERTVILTTAALLAVSLNRALIPYPTLVHVLICGGAAYLMWWGHWNAAGDRASFRRLSIAVVATLGAFLLAWAWSTM